MALIKSQIYLPGFAAETNTAGEGDDVVYEYRRIILGCRSFHAQSVEASKRKYTNKPIVEGRQVMFDW